MTNNPITVAPQDALVSSPADGGVYCVFSNLTDKGMVEFTRTNVLSARPDLKRYTHLDFKVSEASALKGDPASPIKMTTVEAQQLEPPLVVTCMNLHLLMDGLPAEGGATFRVALSTGFKG